MYKNGIMLVADKENVFTIGTMIINLCEVMASNKEIDIIYIANDGEYLAKDKTIMKYICNRYGVELKFIEFTKKNKKKKIMNYAGGGGQYHL